MTIKKLIRKLIADFELQTLTITLPRSVATLLRDCEADGMINTEKFIADSLRSYIAYRDNLKFDNIIKPTIKIEISTVRLPRILSCQLAMLSMFIGADKSDVITTALAYSIPAMLEEYQLQEDYAVEQALMLNTGDHQ